jgi:hypothetical protein
MAEREESAVQLIDEYAWERAEVVPIGDPIPLSDWLAKLDQVGMALGVLPHRRIASGPFHGGWVVSADNRRGRLHFAMSNATLAKLVDRLTNHPPSTE